MPLLPPTGLAPPAAPDPHVLKFPDEHAIAGLLGDLFDRRVAVRRDFGDHVLPPNGQLATFANDQGNLSVVVAADIGFIAHAGASLALIPVGTSELAVSNGAVSDSIQENFYEVINIMASLFNVDPSSHVKLTDIFPASSPDVPPGASKALTADAKPHWFAVSIDGYGDGTLAFFRV